MARSTGLCSSAALLLLLALGAVHAQAPAFAPPVAAARMAAAPAPAGAACRTPLQLLAATPGFDLLAAALNRTSLAGLLRSSALEATVFAATNDALVSFMAGSGLNASQLLAAPDLEQLLSYHVIPNQRLRNAQLRTGASYGTLQPFENLTAIIAQLGTQDNQTYTTMVGYGSTAQIVESDVVACQTVVHAINGVLLPKALLEPAEVFLQGLEQVAAWGPGPVAADLVKFVAANATNVTATLGRAFAEAWETGYGVELGAAGRELLRVPAGAAALSAIGREVYKQGFQTDLLQFSEYLINTANCTTVSPFLQAIVAQATTAGTVGTLRGAAGGYPNVSACLGSSSTAAAGR